MSNLWFDYYLIRFEILALIIACGAGTAVFWVLRRRWQAVATVTTRRGG